MGQAEAAAMAITRALADWTRGQELRRRIAEVRRAFAFGRCAQIGDEKVRRPRRTQKKAEIVQVECYP